MSNESPLHLLQECIYAGGAADLNLNAASSSKLCQPMSEDGSLQMNYFMDILRTKATSLRPYFSSTSNETSHAHSSLRQDFNLSTKVWGVSPSS